jgi:hypothetical protein
MSLGGIEITLAFLWSQPNMGGQLVALSSLTLNEISIKTILQLHITTKKLNKNLPSSSFS